MSLFKFGPGDSAEQNNPVNCFVRCKIHHIYVLISSIKGYFVEYSVKRRVYAKKNFVKIL